MTITYKQQMLIEDFVKTAKLDGPALIECALPANHPMMVSGGGTQMKAIRKVGKHLAIYNDELGNPVVLTAEGLVKQM